ncbi:MAG TPA: aspartyl protease family protein [Candidatus Binatia bacterium]|jgi:predicted aspartyl protease|nr:aspartyl protease family protein [Candidatus Binatia bacterium]
MMILDIRKGPWTKRRTGLTTVKVRIRRVGGRRRVDEEMLVDSGAISAVIPSSTLRRVGINPHGRETFSLSDGTSVERGVGTAFFELGNRKGAAPVIFGEEGDANLLGTIALGALGLMLDPLRRELKPIRLMLAAVSSTSEVRSSHHS